MLEVPEDPFQLIPDFASFALILTQLAPELMPFALSLLQSLLSQLLFPLYPLMPFEQPVDSRFQFFQVI